MKKIFEGFSQSFDDGDGNYIDTFSKDNNDTKARIQACSQIIFSAKEKLNYFSPDSKTMEKMLQCFPEYKNGSLSEGKLRSPWYIYNNNNSTAYVVQIKDVICLTDTKRELYDCYITPKWLWENNYIDVNSFTKLIDDYFGDDYTDFFVSHSQNNSLGDLFNIIRDVVHFDNPIDIVCMIGYVPALDEHTVIFSPNNNQATEVFLDRLERIDKTNGWGETKGYYEVGWGIPGITTNDYKNTVQSYFLEDSIDFSCDYGVEEFLYDLFNNITYVKINKKTIEKAVDTIQEKLYDNNNFRNFFKGYYTLLFDGYLKYLEKNIFPKYNMSNLNNCSLFDSFSILWEYVRVAGGAE